MTRYRIYSESCADMGIWEGETKSAALLALHRDAGYGPTYVWLDEDGDLDFADDETREVCGDVEDWIIEEV